MTLRKQLNLGFFSLIILVIVVSVLSITRFISLGDISRTAVQEGNNKAFAIAKETDHLKWINSVSELFLSEDIQELTVETDHTKCGLGQWIYSDEMKALGDEDSVLKEQVEKLKIPHKELHITATRIGSTYIHFDQQLLTLFSNAWIAHLIWVKDLNVSLLEGTLFDGETNPEMCAFGQWYYTFQTNDPQLNQLLEVWDEPHKELHQSALSINSFIAQGQREEANRIYTQTSLNALAEIEEAYKDTMGYLEQLSETQGEALRIFTHETHTALENTQRELYVLVDHFDHRAATAQKLLNDSIREVIIFISLLSILILLGGVFISAFITRSILRRLGSDPGVIEKIAKDLSVGDMRIDAKIKMEDQVGVFRSMLEMKRNLSDLVANVISGSSQIAVASEQLSSGNQDLSNRTEQQATALEETSAAIEEMTASIKSNADNTVSADQLSREAFQKANAGEESVQKMITSMDEINASSTRIAEIIEVINNIAFQTNLLALNASIEAARAGEQGKGFAVVAVEVRKLAKRSDKAAAEIAQIIKGSSAKVDEGVLIANEAGAMLKEIHEAVNKVTALVAEVSATTQEQISSVEEINNTLISLDENTQKNAAMVEEAASATEELSSQAQELNGLMDFFTVDIVNKNDETGIAPIDSK